MVTIADVTEDVIGRPIGDGETWYEAKYGYAMLVCSCGRPVVIGVPPVYPFQCECGRNVG